ncbi:PP2C family protein-serine/threonine phosphatase [Mycobacterium sp. NPDC051804]|uniref:PP2C family protein-serine/threonine phosphatase n=1 Tax=Mycobacterium sp. NPDC051804 TaxID=3364295 RepID=UPI00378DA6C2
MTNSMSTYVAVPRPVAQADGSAPDRDENQLDEIVLITDRGIEHTRNEDAGAAGTIANNDGPRAIAAVVCDGVSTSADAQNASRAASVAGVDAMLTALAASRDVTSVMVAGLTDAAKAAAESTSPEEFSPASCTYTAAVVVPAAEGGVQIAVANVGDSRVYWLPEPPAQPQRLTVDDTVAQQLISAGIPPDSPAVLRGEHTLTRWFGRDADRESWDESNVHTMTTSERGVLVLCSDGLHNYLPEAADIAKFCIGTARTEAARALVDHALRAGGHDNITVIIVPVGMS